MGAALCSGENPDSVCAEHGVTPVAEACPSHLILSMLVKNMRDGRKRERHGNYMQCLILGRIMDQKGIAAALGKLANFEWDLWAGG